MLHRSAGRPTTEDALAVRSRNFRWLVDATINRVPSSAIAAAEDVSIRAVQLGIRAARSYPASRRFL